ncbi:UNKNOWN [Stylonychia lemnae]|uniref:Transmembrane protein n=1 Tax=Stylonychia lemnae TaxID=5949 RepID=A0A078A7S3_STYLE|nr:UNKNOWN [Stylonychia lemnae]|eukprot:CDW77881.1 UNKNOWN [Stylonychia lemnae]
MQQAANKQSPIQTNQKKVESRFNPVSPLIALGSLTLLCYSQQIAEKVSNSRMIKRFYGPQPSISQFQMSAKYPTSLNASMYSKPHQHDPRLALGFFVFGFMFCYTVDCYMSKQIEKQKQMMEQMKKSQ